MPEERTLRAAEEDRREGKSPSTQAGEFVKEEIEHVREGRHGVRSTKQAIAIGLSKARRAGVKLPPPGKNASKQVRKKAEQDLEAGASHRRKSPRRARATENALKRESREPVSKRALSKQAKKAAAKRSSGARSAAAKKAARTKGASKRSAAAKKAARTRARKAKG
jgi:hypothetical protein